MNTIITIIIIISILFVFIKINDYFIIKKLTNTIKVGDKKRIYNSNETDFEIIEIKEIFKDKKGHKIAKCEYKNGFIENIPLDMLIY